MRLDVQIVSGRLRAPFVSATGSLEARELVLIRLEQGDGQLGFGEAAPLPSYDGVTVEDVQPRSRTAGG